VAVDKNGSTVTIKHPKASWGQPYGAADCTGTGQQPTGCMTDNQIWTAAMAYDGAKISVTVQDGSGTPYLVIKDYKISVTSLVGGQAVTPGLRPEQEPVTRISIC
jgi:hypothetical protein